MTNKTRKHLWPVSLVMSIGIIGALAAFLVLASNPGDTQAHGAGDHPSQAWPACADMTDAQRAIHNGIHENIGSHGTMEPCPTPGTGTPGTDMPATGDMITSDSTSGGSAPEFQVVIDSLPTNLAVGSSIVLYLEDDYQEPASDTGQLGVLRCVAAERADGKWRPGVHHHCAEHRHGCLL